MRYVDADCNDKPIEPSLVERYHDKIWEATTLLGELAKRAIGEKEIRAFRLGVQKDRITIPIKNSQGIFVNVRKHLPGAKDKPKLLNVRNRGKLRLFPIDQLKYSKLLIVGGELKAIAATSHLNKHDIGVVTATGGEGNWSSKLNGHFKDKDLWVCFDIDKAGVAGAEARCSQLVSVAKSISLVTLPLDIAEHPTGDINDFLYLNGDLHRLLLDSTPWTPAVTVKPDETPIGVTLAESMQPEFALKRVNITALSSAVDASPYLVPKSVKITCDKEQPICGICPVFSHDLENIMTIDPEADSLIEMSASAKTVRRDAVRSALGIPKCKSVDFDIQEFYRLDEALITENLDMSNVSADKTKLGCVFVDCKPGLLQSYDMVGRIVPHPRTQKATLIVSESESVEDSLNTFELEDHDELKIFQPKEWTVAGIKEKFDELYSELEPRVTKIFHRRDMHILTDLTYHSCLFMRIGDMDVKGWVETLVVGDSSQGKSWVTTNLAEFYGLGEKVECKNSTVAGLLGGLQKINDRWFASWGVIPMHDRRLVILEELKGMSRNVFSKLTDMRSTGIAEIPKIERQKTHARTRLIALSNPRSSQPVMSYSFGVDVIQELIINLEDIRRFDACMVISEDEVDPGLVQMGMPVIKTEAKFTPELCRTLILWAWTRKPEEVLIDPVWDHIKKSSIKMCATFTERVPIVDKGSMKYKIARLSVAVACRTFSIGENDSVNVRKCHVDYVVDYLTRIYSTNAFGYDRFTKAIKAREEIKNVSLVISTINKLPFRDEWIESALASTLMDERDMCDWCGYDMAEARGLMGILVRNNALMRDGRAYRKTPKFIEVLKRLEATQVPAHMTDDVNQEY